MFVHVYLCMCAFVGVKLIGRKQRKETEKQGNEQEKEMWHD